jgi:aspartyl-tRNA synthetase
MDLRTSLRTHACGELRPSHAGAEVVLCGWVAHRRDHGGVIFLDLRDREGIVQVVFHPQDAPDAHRAADATRGEWVVRITGQVRIRPEGTVNPNLGTGEVEVMARSLEVLSESEPPPFPIEDRIEADEMTRLNYRYLDIRRPEMTRVLRLRAQVNAIIRRYLDERGFVEVETPMLTRSTPEGARDFLVPSRLQPGKFFALPQSPQLFKQILMVAGLDRYYQIVRCFRDENLRADRQFDFTQLDLEMSFVTEEDVYGLMEPLFVELVRETHGTEVPMPFPRLTYRDAMDRFGSDKPDLRYGMELVDVTERFRGSGFRVFAQAVASGGVVKGFSVPGGASLSRRELDGLVQEAKSRGASGLVWLAFLGSDVKSPVSSYLSPEELASIAAGFQASDGDLVLMVADRPSRANVALDGLRRLMADRMGLVREGEWAFCWIVEPPLFEWSEEDEAWTFTHHPFTAPVSDDLSPETGEARGYDITLNGWELGSGSIRIHRPDVQRRIFEVLGIGREEADERFGFLLRAFRYGVPPHGGIAPGLDRVVALLAGKDNIREVIAFPKTQSGQDPLTGAPAPVPDGQLRELGLRLAGPPEGRRPD